MKALFFCFTLTVKIYRDESNSQSDQGSEEDRLMFLSHFRQATLSKFQYLMPWDQDSHFTNDYAMF